jgi:hypothetical protein
LDCGEEAIDDAILAEAMKKEIIFLVLVGMFFTLCLSVDAQQSAKIPRIGYVSNRVRSAPNSPDLG